MSGMGCVGASQGATSAQFQVKFNSTSASSASGDIDAERQQRMNAHLEQALAGAGVDAETAKSIETELQQAFQASKDSGQFPPDPATMKETVDGIFAKYGLDAEEIMGPPPQHGGRPPQGQYGSSTESDDATATLTELLQQLADNGATPEDLAQMFADAIAGVDQTA